MRKSNLKTAAASALFLLAAVYPAMSSEPGSPAKGRHSTNVSIESSNFDGDYLNAKTDPEDKMPTFYSKGDMSVGINEDGDPTVGQRF